jgi:hypothetical protein
LIGFAESAQTPAEPGFFEKKDPSGPPKFQPHGIGSQCPAVKTSVPKKECQDHQGKSSHYQYPSLGPLTVKKDPQDQTQPKTPKQGGLF